MVRFLLAVLPALLPVGTFAQTAYVIPWTTVGLPAANNLDISLPGASYQHWVVGIRAVAGGAIG